MGKKRLKKIIILCIIVILLAACIALDRFYTVKFNVDGALLRTCNRTSYKGIEIFVGKYYFDIYETWETAKGGITAKKLFRIGK